MIENHLQTLTQPKYSIGQAVNHQGNQYQVLHSYYKDYPNGSGWFYDLQYPNITAVAEAQITAQ
jgi:hypothetical protein